MGWRPSIVLVRFGAHSGGADGRTSLLVRAIENFARIFRYSTIPGDKPRFSGIEEHTIDKQQLALANELIRAQSAPFDFKRFKDDYEAAIHELIEAKRKKIALPEEERPERPKVVSRMDALRRSVSESKRPEKANRTPSRSSQSHKKGPALVKPKKRTHKAA